MTSLPVKEGDAFSYSAVEYFVVAISADGTVMAQATTGREQCVIPKNEFLKNYAIGLITLSFNSGAMRQKIGRLPRSLESFSQHDQADALRRWRYIEGLMAMGWESITTGQQLKIAIEQISIAHEDPSPPSCSSVRRWWRRYRTSGCDSMALIPLSERKGGRDRPRLAESVEAIIEEEIGAHFLRRNPPSVRLILDRVLLRVTDQNKWRDDCDKLKPPSLATLYRRISRIPAYDRAVAHIGRDAAKRLFRTVNGGLKVTRLLERVEIDHTQLDSIIVDDEHLLPLGRPWLTVAIDALSRMICGYHISFSAPSANTVLQCLVSIVSPKLQQFDDVLCEWPAYGVPERIVSDNGAEFHSASFEAAAFELGCSVQYCIRRQPEYKGRIERFLGTLNKAVVHFAPGTTRSNPRQKGDYNSTKEACVPLSTIKRQIHKWIVDIYSQEYHRGIGTRPIDAWNEHIKLHAPRVHPSIDTLRQYLGIVESRVLNLEGIKLFGDQRYQSEELTTLRKQLGPKMRVTIKYFPDDIGHIFVQHPIEHVYLRVNNTNPSYAEGLPLLQHEFIRNRLKKAGRRNVSALALANERVKLAEELMWWAQDKRQSVRKRADKLKAKTQRDVRHEENEFTKEERWPPIWDSTPIKGNAFKVLHLKKEE